MKIQLKTLAATAALIAGIISASLVYAGGAGKSPGSMMDQGGMTGQGNMMEQMNQMMSTCNTMMQKMMKNSGKPMPGGKSPDESPSHKK